jgi:VIT1/CCC1 family predicted Fe2+/Mn2+ transporter
MPPDSKNAALKSGLTTFVAFVVFGSVPLLAYTRCLFGVHFGSDRVNVLFTTSVFLTAVTMFLLGVTKAQFTNQNKLESGIIMLMNGIIAAGFAYLIGWSLQEALGISSA